MRFQRRASDKPPRPSRWTRQLQQTVERNWTGAVNSSRDSEIATELAHAEVLQARILDAKYALGDPHVVVPQTPNRSRVLVTLGCNCLSPLLVLLAKTFGHDRFAAVFGLVSLIILLRSLCLGLQIVKVSQQGTEEEVALAWAPSFALLSAYSIGCFDSWRSGNVNPVVSVCVLVVMAMAQFAASCIFTSRFDPTWDGSDPEGEDEIAARNRAWLADLTPESEISNLEKRLDCAFSLFTAVILSLGSFLWAYSDEGRYLLTFIAIVIVCEIGWLVRLGRWEVAVTFEGEARSAGWNVLRVMLIITPLASSGLFVEAAGPNYPENILFVVKVLGLILSTMISAIVIGFLKKVVRPVLGLTSYGHAVGSQPFLVVDQLAKSLSIGKGPWPLLRMRYRAVTDVVATTSNCAVEAVVWESVWARRGLTKRWRYHYSIVWEGNRFYIHDVDGKYRRWIITSAKRFRGKTCGPQTGVSAGYVPVSSGGPVGQDFQLCALRIPPLVPGGRILDSEPGTFSAEARELVTAGPGETVYLVAQKGREDVGALGAD